MEYLQSSASVGEAFMHPHKPHSPPHLRDVSVKDLNDLIKQIHAAFDGDHVDVDLVSAILRAYKSNPADWKKFAKYDRYKYTRNLVDEGNGKFNLMLLCWGPSQASCIHDHTDAHCFMKILSGELEEVRYEWPESTPSSDCGGMRIVGRTPLHTNGVCYINDSLGLHRVCNPSDSDPAVSLHLYCPPFSTCQVFDEATGKPTKCQVTFFSKYGKKIKYCEK